MTTAPENAATQATVYGAGKTTPDASRKPVSLPRLAEMRARGEKITMLTAYDATFAAVADAAGIDTILIGDSLGMVCQGYGSTTGVTLESMVYHVGCVARGLVRVQGKTEAAAATMRQHALELQDAGASMVVLEMVPAVLAAELTQELTRCHTIGIGAGKGTAGQVLVLHDMLGINLGKMPKFVRNFMDDAGSVKGAFEAYIKAVKDGSFPVDAQHGW